MNGPENKPAKPSKWHMVGRVFGAIAGGAATQIITRSTYGGFGGGWGMGWPTGGDVLTRPIGGQFPLAVEDKGLGPAKAGKAETSGEAANQLSSPSAMRPAQ